ncbi:MAG: glycosyltransferase [Bacteroidales bacterium]|nr:glycosyltransferase [Bacteroidales bacterium]
MLSIVVPLYNKEHCVASAIGSVLAQTYADFEIVIVDDGSDDASADIIRSFNDTRIKLISTPNHGVSSARNTGICASRGEYVAFLDADDIWLPNYLEELEKLISECPGASIFGFANVVVMNGEESRDLHGYPEGFRGVLHNVWRNGVPYWTSAVCIARAAFDKVGLFDERMSYGEDMDMWWRVLLEYPGAYCTMPLVKYCKDAENRAMNKPMPFEKHIPYFIEKYSEARARDRDFRFFADREFLYRLFPYAGVKAYRKDLKRVLSQIDFSQQKRTMRLRFQFPRLYRYYMNLKRR